MRAMELVRAPQSARESTRKRSVSYSGFSSKKVRISSKRYRQFAILSVSAELRAERSSAKVALCAKGALFTTICHAPRGQKEMFWFWIWKFACLSGNKYFTRLRMSFAFAKQPIFFVSPIGETWKR